MKNIQPISGVLTWLMKFAVRSYELHKQMPHVYPAGSAKFIDKLKELFKKIPDFFNIIKKQNESERSIGLEFMKTITKCWSIFMNSVSNEHDREEFAIKLAELYSSLFDIGPKFATKMEVHKEWDPAKVDCICNLIGENEFELYLEVRKVFLELANSYVNMAFYKCQSNTLKCHTMNMLCKIFRNLFTLKKNRNSLNEEVSQLMQVLTTLIDKTPTTSDSRRSSNYREVSSMPRQSKATIFSSADMNDSKKSEEPSPEILYSCLATLFLLMNDDHYATYSLTLSQDKLKDLLNKIEVLFDKWFEIKNTWASLKRSLCHAFLFALKKLFEKIKNSESLEVRTTRNILNGI